MAKQTTKRVGENSLKTKIFIYSLIIWPLLHFLIFWVYINFDTVLLTFERYSFQSNKYVFIGLENYKDLIKWVFMQNPNNMMDLAIKNSISIVIFIIFVMQPVSLVFGYAMFKKVPLNSAFKVIFFLPNIISSVVLVLVFQLMFDPDLGPIQKILEFIGLGGLKPELGWFGSAETAWNMVLIECLWAGIGYDMIIFLSGYNRIPTEIVESATLDGAGFFREFAQIAIPLIAPTISTMIIMASGSALTFFMNPLLLTNGGPDGASGTIMMILLNNVKSGSGGLTMAATIGIGFSIVFLPIIFAIRKLVEKLLPSVEF